jgi:hypothetical protein
MRWLFRSALTTIVFFAASEAYCEIPGHVRQATLPTSVPAPRTIGITPKIRFPDKVSDDGSVVAIYYRKADGQTYICTGTLLSETIILTAGHCGCGLKGSYWVNVNQDARSTAPNQLEVVDGAPILFDQRVCRNGQLAGGNDLALIRLRDGAVLAAQGQPNLNGYPPDLVFNLRTQIPRGIRVRVVGYGFTESRGIGIRNQADLPVYSFDCEEATLAGICGPFSEMILADQEAGRPANDTCGGDSGGPVFWTHGGTSLLVGVTSRAAPGTQENAALHCGGGGIYTLVGRKTVQDWFKAAGLSPLVPH